MSGVWQKLLKWKKKKQKKNPNPQSPTFLAPGIGFMEYNFSMD